MPRLSSLISVAALALVVSTTATAADAPRGVSAAFGNTVKAMYPDGKHQWLWFKADGTWEAFGRRGKWSSGRWTQKASEKVCLRQSKPIPIPFNYCTDFPANGGVGAVWSSRAWRVSRSR
ncbi:MAG: hypothetical protein U1C74_09765 [Phenylobacterium sp.]|nr:hypothetical protein [Phenylobacterium sp.]